MSNKVRVKITSEETKYGDYIDTIEVFVNDQSVGSGTYGGEPEDNSRTRDYYWVEDLVESLAKKLGAEVQREIEEIKDE